MTTKNKFGAVVLVAVLLVAGALAMSSAIDSRSWRYKITINIETPEGGKAALR